MSPRAITVADILLVALLLAACWGFWGLSGKGNSGLPEAGVEVISQTGKQVLELTPPRRVHISGPLGESVLQVGPSGARFLSSPCPLQLCVRSGVVGRMGSLVACLPNRVAVRVRSSTQPGATGIAEEVDAVGR